jgi:hypothetical protein
MNTSLRDLGERAGSVPVPQLDVAALVAAGESRIRRRRLAAVAAVTAVVAVVVSAAVLLAPGAQQAAPPPARDTTHAPDEGDTVQTRAGRLLTYSVGTVIHWGDRTVDVKAWVPGRRLDYLDATDDGAVFLSGPEPQREADGVILVPEDEPVGVWFTDGSTPVRIGTTFGSGVRGYPIATSASGSILAWREDYGAGRVVVYDTAAMREVGRFGDEDSYPLEQVFGDAVYWTPDGSSCVVTNVGNGPATSCRRNASLRRFDPATGRQTEVTWAEYTADRRARPGLVTTADGDRMYVHLVARGRELAVSRQDSGKVLPAVVTVSGQELKLRLPAGYRYPDGLDLTQWLDADRVVLAGVRPYVPACSRSPAGCRWTHDDPDVLVCRLSTGSCRFVARLPDNRNTLAGQHGGYG